MWTAPEQLAQQLEAKPEDLLWQVAGAQKLVCRVCMSSWV